MRFDPQLCPPRRLRRRRIHDERPARERGLWIGHGRYYVTKREHLAGIAAALEAAGALRRLTVRAVPDAARCEHTSCRRRRGVPPVERTVAPRPAAPPSVVFGPMLSLAEVMEEHPLLTYSGFGVSWRRGRTPEERRAELADGRARLSRREDSVREIAAWLRDNVTPLSDRGLSRGWPQRGSTPVAVNPVRVVRAETIVEPAAGLASDVPEAEGVPAEDNAADHYEEV